MDCIWNTSVSKGTVSFRLVEYEGGWNVRGVWVESYTDMVTVTSLDLDGLPTAQRIIHV